MIKKQRAYYHEPMINYARGVMVTYNCLSDFLAGSMRKLIALLLVALLLCWTLPGGVWAASGNLDTSFGSGGRVTSKFPPSCCDRVTSIAIQPDGKLVAGMLDSSFNFAVVRYNQNGALDSTFGSGGRVVTLLDNSSVLAVAVQTDGKIIAGGSARNPNPIGRAFTVVRYNTDGTIDSSFGSSGIASTRIGGSDRILDLAIQPDGKIVAAGDAATGSSGDTDCAVVRYNKDGSLDTSFGSGGKVTTNFAKFDSLFDVFIQPDGKIAAAGSVTFDFNQSADFALVRYNADGSLDTSFSSDGKVVTDFFGSADTAFALAFQSDGKYVAAGTATESGSTDHHFALARYSTDGSIDPTFGLNGKVITMFGTLDTAHALVIQADGKLVAGGIAGTRPPAQPEFPDFDFALARYNTDGSLDSAFGSGGKVFTDFLGGVDQAFALALQPDGKLVAGGGAGDGPSGNVVSQLALARYETEVAGPRIIGASVRGKKLFVFAENIDTGAVILLDGVQQKSLNDEENPNTILIGKKSGKKIKRGTTVTLRIRNSNGTLSSEFRFTRPAD